jgi:guanylate kinase
VQSDLFQRQHQPLLIVISGPSGVGKDSVIQRLKSRGIPFHYVVTATTRPRRADEVEGVDYHFVSKDEFARMINDDELLEYAIVYDDYKGIPKQQVRLGMISGKDVIMRVDVQGAKTVRGLSPDALLIFLSTRSEQALIDRLKARETETPEALNLRIATARQELNQVELFDYLVINDRYRLEDTVDTILAIVKAEHHRTHPRQVNL